MTNPITNANILARQVAQELKSDAGAPDEGGQNTLSQNNLADDQTDVGRAHQRLSLEAEGTPNPAIQSIGEARRQLADFRAQLAADPQAALDAHGRIDGNIFEAAMARPTA